MEILLFVGAFALYFLPTIIGWSKTNSISILMLNLFLGWTFIGWVIALVWATSAETPPVRVVRPTPVKSSANELSDLAELKEKGILTNEEFEIQKAKILNR